ncbi:MAG TPA: hypothetical protein VHE34_13745 [Puia sp.]|uniref:hypothetical protein n=1 Tax=Puia sp. TaxID=2045100 RepID=UPI002B6EEF3F|nr:hypothetical protein [Puia sp.]HVU96287.1 hypothetical protein [Puia sp.]
MKHLLVTILFFPATALLSQADAQSLVNTNWKAYIGEPVNDTLVLHIKTDSSFVTDRSGAAVVRSVCKIKGDTLSLDDVDGQFACPSMVGRYKVAQTAEQLVFTLIDDPCDGRAGALPATKWMRAPDPAKK